MVVEHTFVVKLQLWGRWWRWHSQLREQWSNYNYNDTLESNFCSCSSSCYAVSVHQCISVSLYHKTTFQLLISPKLSHCSVLTPICVFKVTILQLASNNSHMCICDIVTCVIMCIAHKLYLRHLSHPEPITYNIWFRKMLIRIHLNFSVAENCAKLPCHSVTVLFSCVSHRHVLLRHSWAASNRVRCYLP